MRLREGLAGLGVWLPLAMADIFGWMQSFDGKGVKRSDVLNSWFLPELAAAVRSDEDECEDRETVENFNRLEEMFGLKG